MAAGPLAGFRVGVTAHRRADEQIRLLTARGAECLHGPVIHTSPVAEIAELRARTEELLERSPSVVVFSTGLGVRGWFEAADSFRLGDALLDMLASAAIYARGAKATGTLATYGLDLATDTPLPTYAAVARALAERGVDATSVALQVDGAGSTRLCADIAALGADVLSVPVYTWSLPEDRGPAERLVRATVDGSLDAVTFTAKPAVENFFAIADAIDLRSDVLASFESGLVMPVCVGPVCAEALIEEGLPQPTVPQRFRLGSMVMEVAARFAASAATIELAGFEVHLQGRLARIAGHPDAWLSERERSVLDVLLERPGAVRSKAELLRRVWSGTEHDEHLVEVAVARLRKRLGPAGHGIETVMRRGYRTSVG